MTWGTRYQTDEQIARENRRLRDEVDSYRIEREREQEERERAAEQRQRERREQMQEQQRSASDWPTAFWKNRRLMEKERNECERDAQREEDSQWKADLIGMRDNWNKSLAEIDRAAEIWAEEQKAVDEAIKQMRARVAEKLRTENPNAELADYIANDDIDGWMSW